MPKALGAHLEGIARPRDAPWVERVVEERNGDMETQRGRSCDLFAEDHFCHRPSTLPIYYDLSQASGPSVALGLAPQGL